MFNEEPFALSPVNFFHLSFDCHLIETGFPMLNLQKSGLLKANKYLLPDTSALCGEEHFAKVGMGWNREGLEFQIVSKEAFQQSVYPEVTRGCSVELFIDTRDVKNSGYNTRFCHHFFFFPEPLEGIQAEEVTKFRTEDAHELCDPKELLVKSKLSSSGYTMSIFIPASCLNGYDPDQFDRLGFTYRINRYGGPAQHFSALTEEYNIIEQPSLWSSATLKT
jgi:hypothetical protein